MAGSSGNGRSMSKVIVRNVWEWIVSGNGCRSGRVASMAETRPQIYLNF